MADGCVDNSSQVKKITDYFLVVRKQKHCFIDCKFGRSDERDGDMTLCDGCTVWFHQTCINEHRAARPLPGPDDGDDDNIDPIREVWFCHSCRNIFTEFKAVKDELATLKELINNIVRNQKNEAPKELRKSSGSSSTVKIQTTINQNGNQTSETELQQEISRLRKENSVLQSRLESTTLFLNQVLDDQMCPSSSTSNMATSTNRRTQNKNNKGINKQAQSRRRNSDRYGNKALQQDTSKIREGGKEERAKDQVIHPPSNGKVLVLGDSQVKRLDPKKLKNIIPIGDGGLKSDQIIMKHKEAIEDNINEVEEVILHTSVVTMSKQEVLSRSLAILMTQYNN